jgi:hypothetical protein
MLRNMIHNLFCIFFELYLNVFLRDHFYFSMPSKAALSILVKAVSSCAFVPIVLHMDAM